MHDVSSHLDYGPICQPHMSAHSHSDPLRHAQIHSSLRHTHMNPSLTRPAIPGLLPRIYALRDDGHVAKLIRAIELCSAASQEYEYECKCKSSCADRLQIRGDALWTKVSQLVVDSAEGEGPNWLRGR